MFKSVTKSPHPLRRIVLLHTQGAWKGIYQLVGDERTIMTKKQQLPASVAATFQPDLRIGAAELVLERPRYVLYREVEEKAA